MKRIKKFESFGYRMPEEVSRDECIKKLDTHGREKFIKKEWDFFEKLKRNTGCKTDVLRFGSGFKSEHIGTTIIIEMHPNSILEIKITISKLGDDLYLIANKQIILDEENFDHRTSFFICDEWEEVIGFLESKINSNPTLKDWNGDDKISKEYSFNEFKDALEFIRKVAQLSEMMNHHPEINWNYDKVKITLFTHDEGKVTKKDIDLARKIDEIKI
jgi:4a-hydroxytetrahydrobiopterin dehydratase